MLFHSALLLSLWFSPADELSLGGVVFDPEAAVVSGVQVMLEHTTDQQRWETTTAADGTFRFDHLALGTYMLKVQKPGYFESETEVRLESSKTVEFTLVPSEKLHEEIDVVARPDPINTDTVAPQETVNDEVIQSIPYTGRRDFLNALTLMPGVLRDNTGQVHIHGSRADQIRYQLDGMNLTDTSGGGLGSNIPMDSIESVDIDLTGYSAEFGKGSGGIVRVHSQFVGNQYRFSLTDFVPGLNFREKAVAEFSPRILFSGPIVAGKLWFMYSGSLRYVQTFVEEVPKPNNELNQTLADQLFKVQWNLKESHVVTVDLLHNSQFYGNTGLSTVRPREATTNFLRRGITLGISDRRLTRGLLVESIFQWTRHRESELAKGSSPLEVFPDLWRGNFYTDRRGSDQRFHLGQTVAWHGLKAGVEFDYVTSDLFLNRRGFGLFDEEGRLISSVRFVGPNSAGVLNQEYGAFLLDRLVLHPKLQIEVGARFDRERVTGRNNLSPRTAFSFLPFGTPRSKISGGAGLFYDNIPLVNLQLPRMQQRYATNYDGNVAASLPAPTSVRVSSALRNPLGLHWNLAWEHEWIPRWVSRINYIQKNGRDQVRVAALTTPNGFDMVFNNSGRSNYRAVELTLDRPIRTDLRFLASYIYSDAKARPSLSLDFPDPAVELIPEALADWNTRHRFVSWGYFPIPWRMNASFSVEARSGFPYNAYDVLNHVVGGYNNHGMPTNFVTNVSVEKEIPIPFKRRVAVRLGVTNLFNRFNPRFVDSNTSSPNFMVFSDSSARHFVGRLRILKK
jgi:outer membrane receptor protein involved in Fe transport